MIGKWIRGLRRKEVSNRELKFEDLPEIGPPEWAELLPSGSTLIVERGVTQGFELTYTEKEVGEVVRDKVITEAGRPIEWYDTEAETTVTGFNYPTIQRSNVGRVVCCRLPNCNFIDPKCKNSLVRMLEKGGPYVNNETTAIHPNTWRS